MYQLQLKKELKEIFNYNYNLTKKAQNVIDRVDDQEDDSNDISELLYEAAENELIWDCRWELIEYYSNPENPISFYDAFDAFIKELSENCFLEEIED